MYTSPEEYFWHQYFEVLELVTGQVEKRLSQASLEKPRAIEIEASNMDQADSCEAVCRRNITATI